MIEHVLCVEADAASVWRVICDLERYAEWNPFVVSCRSTLAVGDAIEMRVRVFPFLAQPQREWILAHEPGRLLCYGLAGMPFGALASRRCHEVTAESPSRCRYESRFELTGWLAPLVAWLLGGRLRAGFGAMSEALGARVEALGGAGPEPDPG